MTVFRRPPEPYPIRSTMLLPKRASVPLIWCASSLLHPTSTRLTASSSSASFLFASAFSTTSRYHPCPPCSGGHFQTTTTTTKTTTAMRRAGSPLSPSSSSKRAASSSSSSTLIDTLLGDKVVVSIEDAVRLHGNPRVKFVDGSWFLSGRNGKEEYMTGPRIQGAIYFDINDIADTTTKPNLKHMMPSKELFASYMDAAGISNDDHVIVYGSKDCMFVHRAWFQMRNMGHVNIHLLQGSVHDWKVSGGPMDEPLGSSPAIPIVQAKDLDLTKPTTYQATDPQNIVDLEEMLELVSQSTTSDKKDFVIVDARSKERYLGQVEEPRPGMRLGHMAGAKNVFFLDLLNHPNNVNELRPISELEEIITAGGVDLSLLRQQQQPKQRLIASCGSGATACTLIAALSICNVPMENCYLYDGSWSEWGDLPDTPIVKEE